MFVARQATLIQLDNKGGFIQAITDHMQPGTLPSTLRVFVHVCVCAVTRWTISPWPSSSRAWRPVVHGRALMSSTASTWRWAAAADNFGCRFATPNPAMLEACCRMGGSALSSHGVHSWRSGTLWCVQVLSVVAQQVLEIQLAVKAKLKSFVFEGSELKLRPSCNVFM